MKKIFIIMVVILISKSASSQDLIFTHNQDSIQCKVMEIGEKSIKYTYPNESLLNVIPLPRVEKIVFESGRVQIITERIIVNGEKDWEKIQITNDADDVFGLTKVKEYAEKVFALSASQATAKKRVLEKVKKAAAKDGCHYLLIISFDASGGAGLMGDSKANIRAIGYKY